MIEIATWTMPRKVSTAAQSRDSRAALRGRTAATLRGRTARRVDVPEDRDRHRAESAFLGGELGGAELAWA